MTFVLRVQGKTKGHVFYSYTEDVRLNHGFEEWLMPEKLKYAEEFETRKEAEELKNRFPNGEDFEVVSLDQANKDYYHN